MSKILVTGAAGFIGSHICDKLLERGETVIGYDNMTSGVDRFLEKSNNFKKFDFVKGDILDLDNLKHIMEGVDVVYHMAANADIRGGTLNTSIDIEQNTIGTYNVLEAMRLSPSAKRICFASSAAALGEPKEFPTPENLSNPIQTSLYGASKMAGEGIISSYCNAFGIEGYCFRFVSLLGPRYPHGHVFDFVKKLREDPNNLSILGDGTAKKSYLHISDCIAALMLVCEDIRPAKDTEGKFQIYHLGIDDYIHVSDSAKIIANELGLKPNFHFGKGSRGWVGDNPFVLLDICKMKKLGWSPLYNIEESIQETANWLMNNSWIFDERI